jgi:hypothetical protein
MEPDAPALQEIAPLLTRAALAQALTARGYPMTRSTLASLAYRGEGPPHARWGRHALYEWAAALDWAHSRMTTPAKAA